MADEEAPRQPVGGYIRPPKTESNCVKFTLFGTNVVIWILGVVVLIVSVVLLCGRGSYSDLDEVRSIRESAITGICLGLILFFTGFLGCCGAAKENVCMLATYFFVLVVALLFEIAVMALALAYVSSSKLDESVTGGLEDLITSGRREDIQLLYNLQENMRCCGARDASDYEKHELPVPPSCYDDTDPSKPYLYPDGCVSALKHYVRSNGLAIGLAAFFTFFLQVCAMAGAAVLMRRKRNVKLPP
ncbi:23 kDa integral membrane protein-like [Ornithodoros turicata]|uniref:23 kDa integral membrane protein-like n=1 Tax=Ornithodoros turicata TaxID=34597 RepID=UPI0031396D4B